MTHLWAHARWRPSFHEPESNPSFPGRPSAGDGQVDRHHPKLPPKRLIAQQRWELGHPHKRLCAKERSRQSRKAEPQDDGPVGMLPKERELEEIIEKVNWTGKKSEKTGSSSVPSPNPENNVKAEVRKADAQMMR
ncbi:MAG: hypothetical protein ACREJU_12500 [Nitrospiraceae bacterium]